MTVSEDDMCPSRDPKVMLQVLFMLLGSKLTFQIGKENEVYFLQGLESFLQVPTLMNS